MTTHTSPHDHERTAAAVRLRSVLDRLRDVHEVRDEVSAHDLTRDRYAATIAERDRILSTFADVVLCGECGDIVSTFRDDLHEHDGDCSSWDLRPAVSVLVWDGSRGWRIGAEYVEEIADGGLPGVSLSLDDEDREILAAYVSGDPDRDVLTLSTGETVHAGECVPDIVDRAESAATDAGYWTEWDDGLSVFREVLTVPDEVVSVPARHIVPGDVVPTVSRSAVSSVSAPSWERGSLVVRVRFSSGYGPVDFAADDLVPVLPVVAPETARERGAVSLSSSFLVVLVAGALAVLALVGPADRHAETGASIGGTEVPDGLHCQEDEVLAFSLSGPGPRPVECVHVDDLHEGR